MTSDVRGETRKNGFLAVSGRGLLGRRLEQQAAQAERARLLATSCRGAAGRAGLLGPYRTCLLACSPAGRVSWVNVFAV